MIQDIRYTGCTARPSGYDSPDGDLELALNLVNDTGSGMTAVSGPEFLFNTSPDYLMFIHKVNGRTHFLRYNKVSHGFGWLATKDAEGRITINDTLVCGLAGEEFVSFAAVGNVAVVSTDRNIHYLKFDAVSGTYTDLGTCIPALKMKFGLRLHLATQMCSDTGYTLLTASAITGSTPDDGYTTLHSEHFKLPFPEFTEEKENYWYSAYHALPEGTALARGTEYKVTVNLQRSFASGPRRLYVYGKRSSGSEWEWLAGAYPTPAESSSLMEAVFTAKADFPVVAYRYVEYGPNGFASDNYAEGNVYFKSGAEGVGSAQKLRIAYTKENLDVLMGASLTFTREYATKKNRFIYPFFIRYALRMYDGSYTSLSAPALMIPNSGCVPAIRFGEVNRLGTCLFLSAFAAELDCSVSSALPESWKDLIAGVDIFVSTPLYTMDTGVEYDPMRQGVFTYPEANQSYGIGDLYTGNASVSGDYRQRWLESAVRAHADTTDCPHALSLAPKTEEQINSMVTSTCVFRKIAEITFDELAAFPTGTHVTLPLKEGCLEALDARPPLDDTPVPWRGYAGAVVSGYNSRLHITSARTILPLPTDPGLQCASCAPGPFAPVLTDVRAWVLLKTDDGIKHVECTCPSRNIGHWFYYPDSRATALIVKASQTGVATTQTVRLGLKAHDFLPGAYWYAGSLADLPSFTFGHHEIPDIPGGNDDRVSAASNIYVSTVANPFLFEAGDTVHVPVGKVSRLATAAKALSQGQFGQFPLYAFTDEGIWALSVTGEGKYRSVQPITRDVCTDPDAITPIDSAVLFPSARGIMLLSGSQSECITDTIATGTPFDLRSLPRLDKIHAMLGTPHTADDCMQPVPFPEFLRGCGILYDYAGQRIILYNPGCSVSYVWCLKSKLWGMMLSDIRSGLNSYPEALAVTKGNKVVDFSGGGGTAMPGMLVTRPLKLGAPDILKTVDTLLLRGEFSRENVDVALYGSRNLSDWQLVRSARGHALRRFGGTPYKYFRIAVLCRLAPGETLAGCSAQFTRRLTGRLH